jgi:hypothetical protein
MRERLPQIEEEITRLETGITECEAALQSFVSAAETQRQTDLLQSRRRDLATLMAEWEQLSNALESQVQA